MSGIGSVLFPVLGGVSICLEFSPNFCTKASDFVIIPDGVTEYNLVIGYDILREEHLLPDPHKGELVSRKGNMVKPVATDIRHTSSIKYQCIVTKDTTILPKTFSGLEISISDGITSEDLLLLESNPNDKIEVGPALLNVVENKALIMVKNTTEKIRKLKGPKDWKIRTHKNRKSSNKHG